MQGQRAAHDPLAPHARIELLPTCPPKAARLPSLSRARALRSSACVTEHFWVARLAAVPRARRLDRRAVRRQLVDAHVAPASARLPLGAEVGFEAD